MKKIMTNENGSKKTIKTGYSWTTFFFGFFPSLFRGDIKSTLKLIFIGIITVGIYPTYKSFNINKDYENFLISKGYKEIGEEDTGFKSHPVLEKVVTWIAIVLGVIRILVLIGIIIFYTWLSANEAPVVPISSPPVQQTTQKASNTSTNNTKTSTTPVVANTTQKQSTSTNTNNSKETTTPAPNTNQTSAQTQSTNNTNNAGNMYKSNVTTTDLGNLQTKYANALATIGQNYGSSYAQYGSPILGGDQQTNIQIGKTFYNQMNTVLNEEWSDLYHILTPDQYSKLQKQELQWINSRDINAEKAANSAQNGYSESTYYIQRGVETRERIQELSQMYF
ncbi:hypothetical protein [uncultured Clostridium sp.]|uniref:hypothetical protein n=1 Tax=uncultured Clostridium sp. TaxID=59620 RepID=UPI00261BFF25|nr:hypothetical protein [uncultured Clostridium sp.]